MQATAQVIPSRFETREVRTMLIDDQPWFVVNDVSAALQYSEASAMTRHLDVDEKGLSIVQTLGRQQLVSAEPRQAARAVPHRKDGGRGHP